VVKNFEGVGSGTDFAGGLGWHQTQNFGSEIEIAVVEMTDVVGISLVDWEV
jgi:hypothetical protein